MLREEIKTKQEKYQGHLQQADLDSLVILSSERAHPGRRLITRKLMKDQILEVRLNKRLLSTIVGGVIGAGIGFSIGAIAGSRAKNKEMNGVVETTLGFAGGLLGSLVGHNVPFIKGKKIYPAP